MSQRKKIWVLAVLAMVLVACGGRAIRGIADAMVDAGSALRDADSDASAQAPTVTDVTCSSTATFSQTTAGGTVTAQTTHYALVTVGNPRTTLVERCGRTSSDPACPAGSTCTGTKIAADCDVAQASYTGSQVLVICSTDVAFTPPGGSTSTTTISYATSRVIQP